MGITLKATLSVPFYGMSKKDIDECLMKLPEYLNHENVVGLGEIGMDAGIPAEEELIQNPPEYGKRAGFASNCTLPNANGAAGCGSCKSDNPGNKGRNISD